MKVDHGFRYNQAWWSLGASLKQMNVLPESLAGKHVLEPEGP